MYLVSLSLLAHRHWRADMSMWCIELEIWLVEQRLPPNATATNWTGGNALQYWNGLSREKDRKSKTYNSKRPIIHNVGMQAQSEKVISTHQFPTCIVKGSFVFNNVAELPLA